MKCRKINRVIFCLLFLLLSLSSRSQEKQVIYLSGTDAANTVTWDFFCTAGNNSGAWKKIEVPSCWEQQGFGSYNYGRDYKTNGKNERFADEQGIYRYSFTVPTSWKDKLVRLVFEGCMTDTEVKINGVLAGPIHQGAFYQFQYNIGSLLRFDAPNRIEVTVSKMSSDASVNNAERLADYWVFGGIFRPVFLEATPMQFIDRVAIDAKHDGTFNMQVQLHGVKNARRLLSVIRDAAGKEVHRITSTFKAGDTLLLQSASLSGVKSWTSETPHLYELALELQDGSGKKLYGKKEKFGFRTVEIRRGEGIYINDVQVKFKGVNRHCWWPETARTLSKKQQLDDVLLLKEMNMNAVRCSHYPPDKYFLQLCDSLGIYVINELAGWQKAYATKPGEKLVKELVLRDRNHPSIIFWANGNEGGTNKELDDDFVKWDFQQRPVIHPHHRPGNAFNGIDCDHYENYYSTQKKLGDSLIYMPTEMLHAQDDGGAAAGMYDFWELHWKSQKSGGVFIWAMVDEAVVRTDINNMLDANGLNANDGILGPYREKEGSFYALREIFAPLQLHLPAQMPHSFDGKIKLENRFHFTNTNACKFAWELINFKLPFERTAGARQLSTGIIKAPAILPGATGYLEMALPAGYQDYDALRIRAFDPNGTEIYCWTTELKSKEQQLQQWITFNNDSSFVQSTDTSFILHAADMSLHVSKKTGQMLGSRNKSNDFILSFRDGPFLLAGESILDTINSYYEAGKAVVESHYSGALQKVKWTMHGNGWVELEYAYSLQDSVPFAGVSFNYPENYVLGAKWLGKGPSRQWKNRLAGTLQDVWQNLYNNTHTGYAARIYPEFKGYYGNITWMELNTVEGKLYIASPDTGLFIRLFDFYGLSSANKPHPELPAGNISFLDAIPPIGSKLATGLTTNTRVYGPMSEMNLMKGIQQRRLLFYFGLPKFTDSKEKYSRPEIDSVF